MKLHLYTITNTVNNKKYVGQTGDLEQRWYAHLSYLRKGTHHSVTLQRAFDKYGESAFVFAPLAGPFATRDEVNYAEEVFIKRFNTLAPYGYNHRSGGLYTPMTPASRLKLSRSLREFYRMGGVNAFYGQSHSEETKAILSAATALRMCTDAGVAAAIEAGKAAWVGEARKRTFEGNRRGKRTRAYRQSHSLKLRKGKPFPQLRSPNGTTHSIEVSLSLFCKNRGLSQSAMSLVLQGRRNHHKGWRLA